MIFYGSDLYVKEFNSWHWELCDNIIIIIIYFESQFGMKK